MKKFFKFVGGMIAAIAAVVGGLAILDKLNNKNRIKNGYLECDITDAESEE